jgi:hypothetical protein
VSVDCTYLDASLDGFPAEVTVTAAEPANLDVPVGATCTATETDDAGATAVTYEPEGGEALIPATHDLSAEVTITNDFSVGSLLIVKEVIGAGVPEFSQGPFTFDVVCAFDGDPEAFTTTVTIAGSADGTPVQSDPIEGLPIGAECTVTETDSAGADFTPLAETVTVAENPDAAPVAVTFIDPFSAGTISVEKSVSGDAADLPGIDELTYAVDVQCAVAGEGGSLTTLVDETVELAAAGERVTVVDDVGNPRLLRVGARCWGTEVRSGEATSVTIDADSFETGVAVADQPDGPQDLTIGVTNTYDPAVLAVSKTVVRDEPAGAEYTFTISCTLTDLDGSTIRLPLPDDGVFMLAAGERAQFDTVAGAVCAVVEFDAPAGAVGTIIDEDGTEQDVSDGVVTATDTAAVDFTNTFADPPTATGPTTTGDVSGGGGSTSSTTVPPSTAPSSTLPRTE